MYLKVGLGNYRIYIFFYFAHRRFDIVLNFIREMIMFWGIYILYKSIESIHEFFTYMDWIMDMDILYTHVFTFMNSNLQYLFLNKEKWKKENIK